MRSYYATDWHPLLKAAPYLVAAVLVIAALAVTGWLRDWANRPHLYDWCQDPDARADLYTDEALAGLAAAIDSHPDRVAWLLGRDERKARADLYPNGGDVIALPVNKSSRRVRPPAA